MEWLVKDLEFSVDEDDVVPVVGAIIFQTLNGNLGDVIRQIHAADMTAPILLTPFFEKLSLRQRRVF